MRAICVIRGDFIDGFIYFNQLYRESPVYIEGIINGLKPGIHYLTINHFGDISNGCVSTGGFFNIDYCNNNKHINNNNHNNNNNNNLSTHNSNNSNLNNQNKKRNFIGDLGNIYTNSNGRTIINIKDNLISLFGDSSACIVGRSVVILPTNEHQTNIFNGSNNYNFDLINGLGCGIIGIALEKSTSHL